MHEESNLWTLRGRSTRRAMATGGPRERDAVAASAELRSIPGSD
jgi:hypothetical protein